MKLNREAFFFYAGYYMPRTWIAMDSLWIPLADFLVRLLSHPRASWPGEAEALFDLHLWLARENRFDLFNDLSHGEICHELKNFFAEYIVEKRHRETEAAEGAASSTADRI